MITTPADKSGEDIPTSTVARNAEYKNRIVPIITGMLTAASRLAQQTLGVLPGESRAQFDALMAEASMLIEAHQDVLKERYTKRSAVARIPAPEDLEILRGNTVLLETAVGRRNGIPEKGIPPELSDYRGTKILKFGKAKRRGVDSDNKLWGNKIEINNGLMREGFFKE